MQRYEDAFGKLDMLVAQVLLTHAVVLTMADYGVDLYGNAIIVGQKFAAENPDASRADPDTRAQTESFGRWSAARPGR